MQSLLLAAAPAPPGGLPKFIPAEQKGRSSDKVWVGAGVRIGGWEGGCEA